MNEMQNKILDILIDIDKIAKENKIYYSIAGGTLLGAIRNNSFIPWDDDIDLDVDQEELEKFMTLLHEKLPKKYQIVSPKLNSYCKHNFGMVIDKDNQIYQAHYDHKSIFSGLRVDIVGAMKYHKPKLPINLRIFLFLKWARNFVPSNRLARLNKVLKLIPNSYLSKKIDILLKKHIEIGKKNNGKYTISPVFVPLRRKKYTRTYDIPSKKSIKSKIKFEKHFFPIYDNHKQYCLDIFGPKYMTPDKSKNPKHKFKLRNK